MKRADEVTGLRRQAAGIGVSLTEEGAGRLLAFERLLVEVAIPTGLVGAAEAERLRERHLLDCLRAAAAVEPTDRSAADLGSGAGLPGIVVAAALPRIEVTLVERRHRRVAFCELAVERLGLENVRVLAGEIEGCGLAVDLCFARALAPLPEAWRLAAPLLREGGRLVYFAGGSLLRLPPVPGARLVRTIETPVLEGAGPLAIMSRQ